VLPIETRRTVDSPVGRSTRDDGAHPARRPKELPMSTARLTPHLVCRDAHAAIAFYQRALGAEPQLVLDAPDGALLHACLRINGAQIFLCEECPAQGVRAPDGTQPSPVALHLEVDDVDAAFDRAIAAGCTAELPPQDMFWGDRFGAFVDPFGHRWSVATQLRQMSEPELRAAAAAACTAP
jgi:PhnB protein